jgi:AcrR family transcriptional regulator
VAAPSRTEHTRRLLAQSAYRIIGKGGIKSLTMISAAQESGLARATVYNYVRDKDQLLDLAIAEFAKELRDIALHQSTDSLRGLYEVSSFVAQHPLIVGLRTFNPDVLHRGISHVLALQDDIAAVAMETCQTWGFNADLAAAETVVRWLSSYAWVAGSDAEREAGAEVLAASLRIDARL